MTHEVIEIESKDADRVHILAGTIVSTGEGVAEVDIDDYEIFADVPVFYHCENSETADGMPFMEDDRVIIVNSGEDVNLANLKVVGFEDGLPRICPVETVYITMVVGASNRCFVWDASKNACASIKLNGGAQASFPCDPDDISDWLNGQTGAGASLYSSSNCGRSFFYAPEVECRVGNWGTYSENADNKQELSDCGCEFMDEGECLTVWDFTTKCYYAPYLPSNPWMWSGTYNNTRNSHILYQGSKKFIFRNNSGVEDAFRIEAQYSLSENGWTADGTACGGQPCDNYTLNSSICNKTYKYHTPLGSDILEINGVANKVFDACAWTGAYSETDYLIEEKLNNKGVYSGNIIAQIYTVEAKTVTRTMDGAVADFGCVGGDCSWISQTYTTYGLKLTAQVGIFEDTDGIDPTSLSCNSSFELAITGMYDALKTAENIPDDEMAYAIIGLSILKG